MSCMMFSSMIVLRCAMRAFRSEPKEGMRCEGDVHEKDEACELRELSMK